MATRASKVMLRYVFVGGMSFYDTEIERRPYHRNCGCALHKSKGTCSDAGSQQKNITFRKKRSWNECSLSIKASNYSSQSSFLGNSSIRLHNNLPGDWSIRLSHGATHSQSRGDMPVTGPHVNMLHGVMGIPYDFYVLADLLGLVDSDTGSTVEHVKA